MSYPGAPVEGACHTANRVANSDRACHDGQSVTAEAETSLAVAFACPVVDREAEVARCQVVARAAEAARKKMPVEVDQVEQAEVVRQTHPSRSATAVALVVPEKRLAPEVLAVQEVPEVLASLHHLEEHHHLPCPARCLKHHHSAMVVEQAWEEPAAAAAATDSDLHP